jgi:hypothetical protein
MRRILLVAAIAATTIAPVAAAAARPVDREAQLARIIRDRVAGEPVDCIDLSRIRSSRIVNDTALVYDAGSIIYVNRPRSGADQLNRMDTQVVRSHVGRLCSIDVVQMIDPVSGTMSGLVFLGDFVPYRRPRNR